MSRPAYISPARAFDPTADVFVAMHGRPAGLGNVELASLSPFQRALLTIDGTVTQFIEAYSMEQVLVRVLDHTTGPAADAAPWLGCDSNTRVLQRRSALVGADTERLYAYAESVLLPDRLSADMLAALKGKSGGLGKILLQASLESRREALWYGMETLRELPQAIGTGDTMFCLTRTYRILTGGEVLMLITEHFPVDQTPAA